MANNKTTNLASFFRRFEFREADEADGERPSTSSWKVDLDEDPVPEIRRRDEDEPPDLPKKTPPAKTRRFPLIVTPAAELNAAQLKRSRDANPRDPGRAVSGRGTPKSMLNRVYPKSKSVAPPDPTRHIVYPHRRQDDWDNVDPSLVPRRQPKPKRQRPEPEELGPQRNEFHSGLSWARKLEAEAEGRPSDQREDDPAARNKAFVSPLAKSPGKALAKAIPVPTTEGRKAAPDDELRAHIESEIVSDRRFAKWEDVLGLEETKKALQYATVWPMLARHLFVGIRAPSRGVLLYGPPGTGKTMLASCVAGQCGATFFNISAASVMSKWSGQGEKLVRTLFAVARSRLPAVIFCDEIDGLLSARGTGSESGESTLRLKNEFLAQMDGLDSDPDEKLLVLGATNRPFELDEAARRRFTQRIYIRLPEVETRAAIVQSLIGGVASDVGEDTVRAIAEEAEGYSGADLKEVCRQAAVLPIQRVLHGRDPLQLQSQEVLNIQPGPVLASDLRRALAAVRPSVDGASLARYEEFRAKFGTEAPVG